MMSDSGQDRKPSLKQAGLASNLKSPQITARQDDDSNHMSDDVQRSHFQPTRIPGPVSSVPRATSRGQGRKSSFKSAGSGTASKSRLITERRDDDSGQISDFVQQSCHPSSHPNSQPTRIPGPISPVSRPKEFNVLKSITGVSGGTVTNSAVIASLHLGDGATMGVTIGQGDIPLIDKIKERTTKEKLEWRTKDMVKTSYLTQVMDKLASGVTWVTIKGSPGAGKTTTAYMVLDELHKTGRQVFKVTSPSEFSEVTTACPKPVIMLDDIFGDLEFNETQWSRWKTVLFEELGEREHRFHEKGATSSKQTEVTVILVGRDYVLKAPHSDMGKMSDFFTHDSYVVNMFNVPETKINEKQAIWEAVSKDSGIQLDKYNIDDICETKGPHGFPHTCKLFVKHRQDGGDTDAKYFFEKPLKFLNQTINKFMDDKAKVKLFKEIIIRDGKISCRELEEMSGGEDLRKVADNLVGTYLREDDGTFVFDHPSIYDSVAFNLCNRCTKFVIQNCSLSFLKERTRLKPSSDTQIDRSKNETELVYYITGDYRDVLIKRFVDEISNMNVLEVLSHRAFAEKGFISEVMSHVTEPLTRVLDMNDFKNRRQFIWEIGRSKSPELLKYVDNETSIQLSDWDMKDILLDVCYCAATDVLSYMIETRGTHDMGLYFSRNENIMWTVYSCGDSEFIELVRSLGVE